MQDYDYLMLENLTYLDEKVSGIQFYASDGSKKDYLSLDQCDTVEQFLNQFSEKELDQLDNGVIEVIENDKCIIKPDLDKQEWAARIRYMKDNGDICSLKVKEANADNHCILFEDPNNSNQCIVAFKGTSGGDEWVDNIEGLDRSDTDAQMNAKNYIDGLKYDSVIVIGHSKGGNKAMYVAVTCDKVDKCVSYDGQGFSQEFIDKYSVEIQKNASKITNYSLKNDYVHILMFPVPGAKQIYMEPGENKRVNEIGGAHYPIGPFALEEKDGKWYIKTEDGLIKEADEEDPAMKILHNFTTFFMNNASKSDRTMMVAFLSPLITMIMNNKLNDVAEYIKTHREGAIKIAAFLLKYLKENGMGVDELVQICESIGISREKLFSMVCEVTNISDDIVKKVAKITNMSDEEARVFIGEVISKYVFGQITDGEEDDVTHFIIGLFAGGQASEIKAWWTAIENEYNNIHVTSGSGNYQSKIRNYSVDNYNRIMNAIASFENNSFPDVSAWNQYSGESWFSKLLIPSVIKCINGYKNKLSSINSECRIRVNSTFDNIEKVDSRYGKRIDAIASDARTLKFQILN